MWQGRDAARELAAVEWERRAEAAEGTFAAIGRLVALRNSPTGPDQCDLLEQIAAILDMETTDGP